MIQQQRTRGPRSMEQQAKRHLAMLNRRMCHLKQRIADLPEPARQDAKVLSYDRAEAKALEWAINELGKIWNYESTVTR